MSKISNFALLALLAVVAAAPAYALQSPRPIATDSRIRTVRYSQNEVYQFIGHYGFQSAIEFEADEKIQTVSVGDSVAWLINPSGNRLFLKPIEQNALTNMTVITDKRSYLFELHAEETKDIRAKEMVFSYRFIYPQSDASAVDYSQTEELPDIEKNPQKFNFNYSIRGSNVIEPVRIFDDGEFTYFEFKDKNAEVPAFFRVDSTGNDELINFRKRANYIVVERVASRFTLRRGADIICVYNEAAPSVNTPVAARPFLQRVREYSPF
ncbi:MAG: P-type conjugative transfer protein VirB9 [Alphaproteobacteria bacterium]|nr:P-type conjugative transfer protein VirB9 [Alphaproteobacteria bacterium]